MTVPRMIRSIGFLLVALVIVAAPGSSFAQGIGVSINIAPPALPVYSQPICPGEGYIWTPGYWAWDDGDYYWVPGTWVLAPETGFLWTPGYWGWGDGGYLWHDGYWGQSVGFYGGIDYGYGYGGNGYDGGYWRGQNFYYNTAVMNVNRTVIRNTYNKTVIHRTTVNRVSYNGGRGGINARPTAQQQKFSSQRRIQPTSEQATLRREAAGDRSLRLSSNHGKPPIAATPKPTNFRAGATESRTATENRNAESRTPTSRENVARDKTKTAKPATTREANTRPSEEKPARTSRDAATSVSRPARPVTTEHSTERSRTHTAEATPGNARRENNAKAESAKPVRRETTAARPSVEKPTPSHRENSVQTESKPTRTPATERSNVRPAETRPAPAPRENPSRSESRAPEPARNERANAPPTTTRSAPERQASAAHESAPRAERPPAPRPESKPAPREEKKPPR